MKKNTLKATPTERLSCKFSISTLCAINSQQSSFVLGVGTKVTIGPWTIINSAFHKISDDLIACSSGDGMLTRTYLLDCR